MMDTKKIGQRWSEFRPSKPLWFWSCAGSAVATLVVGFSFGGWVTGGTAAGMAEAASTSSRAQLAANICVERFVNAPDFGVQLAALKEESIWTRDRFIEDAGWTTLGSLEDPVDEAADLCAEQLAGMDAPPVASAVEAAASVPETAVQ